MIFSSPTISLAWGPEAHKIIAFIAWDELKPNAKRRIWDLMFPSKPYKEDAGEQAFVAASTWADNIKVDRPQYDNQEHFIERLFPQGGAPTTPNLVTALNKNWDRLQPDSDSDANDRLESLLFIIHYVGDIHQPLHCASRTSTQYPNGDSGANRLRIMVPDFSGKLRDVPLHRYWDTGLDSFSESTFTVKGSAKEIKNKYPDENKENIEKEKSLPDGRPNFEGWSRESFKLAQEVAYAGIEDGGRVSVRYRYNGINTVNMQLATAGYRLGKLLNAIWH